MKTYLPLFTLYAVLIIIACGCDKLFITEVYITPLTEDRSEDIIVINSSDIDKAIELFKKIADDFDYPISEEKDLNGSMLFYANGPNWYGPMMDFKSSSNKIVITVSQYAGQNEYPAYQKLREEVYKVYLEEFGQNRVSTKKLY